MGLGVLDCSGEVIGQVVDTWPDDGGWEVELVVVRLLRFGERRMLPVGEVRLRGGWVLAPFTRVQIEDAPAPAGASIGPTTRTARSTTGSSRSAPTPVR